VCGTLQVLYRSLKTFLDEEKEEIRIRLTRINKRSIKRNIFGQNGS